MYVLSRVGGRLKPEVTDRAKASSTTSKKQAALDVGVDGDSGEENSSGADNDDFVEVSAKQPKKQVASFFLSKVLFIAAFVEMR